MDLRHLNKGSPGDTFKSFFEELEKLVEEEIVADERRHDISHMPQFFRIRDHIAQVKAKLPKDTPIPSEATVLYLFATSNCLFVSCDNKAKADYSEPGTALSTGVRGKKSLIPINSTLGILDRDVSQKGSITPAVSLLYKVPGTIDRSFYRGTPIVTLQHSVFQGSNSFRSILELNRAIINIIEPEKLANLRYFFMITDGGPQHNVTYESVKIPLSLLFKELKVDILIAIRTAPVQSNVNIAQRMMSILNIGYQNVALEREPSPSDDSIKNAKILKIYVNIQILKMTG